MLQLEENNTPTKKKKAFNFRDFNLSFFQLLQHQNTESTSLFLVNHSKAKCWRYCIPH